MTKRTCYIHVGPYKTGTISIEWFFQGEPRRVAERGYLVSESETKRGSHHAIAEAVCVIALGGEQGEGLVGIGDGARIVGPGGDLNQHDRMVFADRLLAAPKDR